MTSRASAARATRTRLPLTSTAASDSTSDSATKRSGTMSAVMPCSGRARAVPGPIAATVVTTLTPLFPPAAFRPTECPASTAASSASNSRCAPLGLVRTISAYSPISSTARRTSSLSIRGSIRIAGSSTTSAPSPRRVAARPLAWARARVTTTRRPWSGRRSSQAERLASRHHRADDDQRRGLRPPRARPPRPVCRAWRRRCAARPSCRARPPRRARPRRARRRSAPRRCRPAA